MDKQYKPSRANCAVSPLVIEPSPCSCLVDATVVRLLSSIICEENSPVQIENFIFSLLQCTVLGEHGRLRRYRFKSSLCTQWGTTETSLAFIFSSKTIYENIKRCVYFPDENIHVDQTNERNENSDSYWPQAPPGYQRYKSDASTTLSSSQLNCWCDVIQ